MCVCVCVGINISHLPWTCPGLRVLAALTWELGLSACYVLCSAEKRCMLHYPYAYPVIKSFASRYGVRLTRCKLPSQVRLKRFQRHAVGRYFQAEQPHTLAYLCRDGSWKNLIFHNRAMIGFIQLVIAISRGLDSRFGPSKTMHAMYTLSSLHHLSQHEFLCPD